MLIVGGGGLLGGSTFAALRALTPIDNTMFAPISYSFADTGRCILTAQAVEGPYYVDEALGFERPHVEFGRVRRKAEHQLQVWIRRACLGVSSANGADVDTFVNGFE